MIDESCDDLASYFNRETTPKILITTTDRPSKVRKEAVGIHIANYVGRLYVPAGVRNDVIIVM